MSRGTILSCIHPSVRLSIKGKQNKGGGSKERGDQVGLQRKERERIGKGENLEPCLEKAMPFVTIILNIDL